MYLLYPFVILMLLFPIGAHGQAVSVSTVGENRCAVEFGKVISGDGTICKDDIAFGMLYELFPSIFNELLPMWDLTMFSGIADEPNQPTLLGVYHGDRVFFTLFELFFDLIIYCIAIYLSIVVISVAVRLLKGEGLTDREDKDNPISWVFGIALGGSFLIPIKNFFLGQLIVFSIGLMSLSAANFMYSVFLSGNQNLFSQTINPTRVTETQRNTNVINRHIYVADSFYRYLTRMELCRTQTAKYIISATGQNSSSSQQYLKMYKCSAGMPQGSKVVWDPSTEGDYPAFMWRKTTSHLLDLSVAHTSTEWSGIEFKSNPSADKLCLINDEYSYSFECGGLDISIPNWGDNKLIKLFNNPTVLFGALDELASQLSPEMDDESVKSIISSKWGELRTILEESLVSAWNAQEALKDDGFTTIDNEVLRKGDALRDIILEENNEIFNDAAKLYHLHAMNVLTVGQKRSYRASGRSRLTPVVQSNDVTSALEHHMNNASKLANIIEKAQCMDYRSGNANAKATQEYLNGSRTYLEGNNYARCLDVITAQMIEENEDWNNLPPDELMDAAIVRYEEIRTEFTTEWNAIVTKFALQRRAVESSYAEVVNNGYSDNFWIKLRGQGYLSAAGYAQSMNNKVNGYKRDVMQIINNFEVQTPGYDSRYISYDVIDAYDIQDKFPAFLPGDEILESTSLKGVSIDPLVRPHHWVAKQEQLIRQPGLSTGELMSISSVMSLFNAPSTYFDRLGLDLSQKGKSLEACVDDPEMCPFPLTDPVVELSLMGHDMVDMAIGFYTVTLAVRAGLGITEVITNSRKKSNSLKDAGQSAKSLRDDAENAATKGNSKGALTKMLSVVGGLIGLVYDVLGTVMGFFLAIGLALAYILPVVPKVYLYMGFISWVMVLVMASFSVLLWCLYWIRFKEKRQLLKQAGYHYGVELMFKPSFNLIAVLFAWYFFYIIAFVVGVSIGWVWSLPLSGEGQFLRGYTDALFVVIVIGFVYFVGLKYAYQLMDDLSGQLLEKLGVRNKKVKDEVSVFIKALLFDTAQKGWKGLHDKAGFRGGNSQKNKDMNRLKNSQKVIDDMQKERGALAQGGRPSV
jgi:hypothetical protein